MEAPIATAPPVHLWPVLFKRMETNGRCTAIRGHQLANTFRLFLWQTDALGEWKSRRIDDYTDKDAALAYAATPEAWEF